MGDTLGGWGYVRGGGGAWIRLDWRINTYWPPLDERVRPSFAESLYTKFNHFSWILCTKNNPLY